MMLSSAASSCSKDHVACQRVLQAVHLPPCRLALNNVLTSALLLVRPHQKLSIATWGRLGFTALCLLAATLNLELYNMDTWRNARQNVGGCHT